MQSWTRSRSLLQRLFHRRRDLEDAGQPGKIQNVAGRVVQATENEPRLALLGLLQAFDQAGHAGAIDVVDALEVEDNPFLPALLEQVQDDGSQLGRALQVDVALNVHHRAGTV